MSRAGSNVAQRGGITPARTANVPQGAMIVTRPRRPNTVAVEIEALEAGRVQLRVVTADLVTSRSREQQARIRYEQAKDQLRRAGIRHARGSLPFLPSTSSQSRPQIRRIQPVVADGRRAHGATIYVRVDDLEAAFVRLKVTTEELEASRANEFELRVRAEQAEGQLRNARIRLGRLSIPRLQGSR